jgi:hypothetical protein
MTFAQPPRPGARRWIGVLADGLSAMIGVLTAGEGVAVGFWARLGVTAVVSLVAGAGLWAALNAAGTDPGIAGGAAAGLATVVVTLGAVWASRARESTAAIARLKLGHVEVACWSGAKPLRFRGTNLPYCHFLSRADWDAVTEDWHGRT